jgi:hypothetical protein
MSPNPAEPDASTPAGTRPLTAAPLALASRGHTFRGHASLADALRAALPLGGAAEAARQARLRRMPAAAGPG